MNRNKVIKTLVSRFEQQIGKLPDEKLKELESGKLELNLIQPVGQEAGGAGMRSPGDIRRGKTELPIRLEPPSRR
ncbi:hypothetical protein [Legionella micdadei]|uniref:Uncharacterized protein n=1 Tax=Legionella micdadei TaxID=451 RepID=A0A098GD40_LEGMI|nr:hypothetical protein [Legionella micdadei]ARG97975.1 hypothetical protein B6N58_10065 [Legionella micdadei]ARG99707.1 hypothetical protein B6V88_04350 [Legionella micdadei]KTD30228.1 hypothetical protein Lmic_0183 [Legionella micdadei]NSL19230.1 hypothetical protein [Legionella micdadei]CEG60403.1 protein of unknown function [Legionella micdadei]